MSGSGKKASEEELAEPADDSVYDFLYHDARRIGSFLAQFDESGHLQQITQTETAAKAGKRGWSVSAGAGIDAASGHFGVERGPAESGSEASARVYDPLWSNALTLLDFLAEKDLIHRDLSTAPIGSLVLVTGELSVLDLTMVRKLWDLPSVRSSINAGAQQGANRQARRAQERSNPTKKTNEAQMFTEVLGILPHLVQARVTDKRESVWCNLSENNMIVPSSELLLKHGTSIPGSWSILGVLDAKPDNNEKSTEPSDETDVGISVLLGGFGALIKTLEPIVRTLLGRPRSDFGATPLLIFRRVAA